jgi:hypothetical protein
MALLGNRSLLHKSPGRFLSAGVATFRSNFNKHGMMRSSFQALDAKSAIPLGHLAPSAWVPPKTAGGMSAFTGTNIIFDSAATLAGGVNIEGTASITFDAAPSLLNLIANLEGTTTVTFTVPNAVLGGAASLEGTTTVTFTSTPALLGGSAAIEGTTNITFNTNGVGTMTAIGFLAGPGADPGLTPQNIANAVWAQLLEAGYTSEQLLSDLARLHGLVGADPLEVTATTRTAGSVEQSISEAAGVVTVTRV